ncbi:MULTISPECIES: pyridoxamine 5'-phosphate oxidase family protein [Streptomyces]|uniref:pyridoxamine 5'-phosphate oxidase family protein n=1 Tax=Streptomyces TaxID=1883 RepID=UPI00163CA2A8|nr:MULTISPECIES: pyridoxamine 5'-phosphate oxidase family protein [Streptomyces]MBC2875366.1 pyridoxamine 5'-phosphate oxidase family protein [Streptomyces sp. TYQ1024]UBI35613.1 pyridoxamine 5'-phosphate oxidase family protein [Streptomyces mobaraensis]UKW28208.1 pyridoxamine 5'-phosphate oxidase family protein [Streptomyces sp. TYQ1024]
MAAETPRELAERLRDTRKRLEEDVDVWLSSADAEGCPYLVPLSFLWDGTHVLVSTVRTSPTSRNLLASGRVRLALGPTRDVVLVEGVAEAADVEELPPGTADAFALKTGFDPRELDRPYQYFRIRPVRIQAWREANELVGRELMRDGHWLG